MRFSREQIENIALDGPRLGYSTKRRLLARSIQLLRTRIRREIEAHMQPWMVLLDESVQFFVSFEKYQYSRKLTAATSAFALHVSRLRSTSLAIRELVAIGQEAPASALARIFIEDIEIAMALADDPAFAEAYSNADDSSDFWKKNLAYGKLAPRIASFLGRGGRSDESIAQYMDHHRHAKNSLSSHVHGANYSAFRSGAVPSLTHPGMIAFGSLGALSAHFPSLCLLIAEETNAFAGTCINVFIRPNPPPALADYIPSKLLSSAITSAHILQHLVVEHGEELWQKCDAFFGQEAPDAG